MAGLLSWKKRLARELDENITSVSGDGYDTDHPTCPECGSTMNFIGHDDLKRLYMPESWKGNPLKKDYVEDDEKLRWND